MMVECEGGFTQRLFLDLTVGSFNKAEKSNQNNTNTLFYELFKGFSSNDCMKTMKNAKIKNMEL
jgi:hypothetical protein